MKQKQTPDKGVNQTRNSRCLVSFLACTRAGYAQRYLHKFNQQCMGVNLINYAIALLMLCVPLNASFAEYYKYKDANGNVIFTDSPSNIPEGQRANMKTVMEPAKNSETSPDNNLPGKRPLDDQRKMQDEEMNKYLKEYGKRESSAKESCPSESRQQAERAIRASWTGMAQAMVAGNREKAFGFFSVFSRDEMNRRMSGMKQEELKRIFSNYKSIEIGSLHENDGVAECGVLRQEGSETYSYPASFVRDPDCQWRIWGL